MEHRGPHHVVKHNLTQKHPGLYLWFILESVCIVIFGCDGRSPPELLIIESTRPNRTYLASDFVDNAPVELTEHYHCRNVADHDISIVNVRPSCTCVQVGTVSPNTAIHFPISLKPQGEVDFYASFDLHSTLRAHSYTIAFSSKGQHLEEHLVTLGADVLSDLDFDPPLVVFDDGLRNSERLTITRRLRSSKKPSCNLKCDLSETWVSASDPCVLTAAMEIAPNVWMQSWQTELVLVLSQAGGKSETRLTITGTDNASERSHSVRIPIVLRRSGQLEAPSRIDFGVVNIGTQAKRKLMIRSATGSRFQITRMACASPEFTSNSMLMDPATEQWCDIEYAPRKKGDAVGMLKIFTTHDNAELRIELRGVGE